jgi:aryl-phospho-beta-D-glucosidase BglC (GH1 family)
VGHIGAGQQPFPAPSPATPTGSGNGNNPPTPFDYNRNKVRGVNLGGWFVLESWITPTLFLNTSNNAIVDEFTFNQFQSPAVVDSFLQQHWSTFYTEDDFRQIAAAKLNHVRIPVGYWSIPTNQSVAPFNPGAWAFILDAVGWARDYGLTVIIDLHGAPGSQNGYDNSGQGMGYPSWQSNPSNVVRTLQVIDTLAAEFSKSKYNGTVSSIELLNEPAGFYDDVLGVVRKYWQDGYNIVRGHSQSLIVVIGDAFKGLAFWNGFMTFPAFSNVMMDTHVYQVFSEDQLARTPQEHIDYACTTVFNNIKSYASQNVWTIAGEFSNAITDCAGSINGKGTGARYDLTPGRTCDGFTGSYTNWTDDYKAYLRRYWDAQVTAFEQGQGWVFWAWKTERSDEWSYQKGLEGGWIPRDPSERLSPPVCG